MSSALSQPRIFVINLDKDQEKRKHIEALLSSLGMKAEFVLAVNGSTLTASEIASFLATRQRKPGFERSLSKPEIGCFLSHQKIYERIVSESIPYSLILEDDVEFVSDFTVQLNATLSLAQSNEMDIVLLGSHHDYNRHKDVVLKLNKRLALDSSHTIGYPAEHALGAYGYLVTLNGAKKLLKLARKYYCPIDTLTGDTNFSDCKVVKPSLILVSTPLLSMSNLESLRVKNIKDFRLRKRVFVKLGLYPLYSSIKRFARIAKNLLSFRHSNY